MDYSFTANKMVGFVDAGDEFWEGLEEGAFRLSRCAACKVWIWPTTFRCGECGSWDQEWVDVEPLGVISGWIRSNRAFPGVIERAGQVPYVTVEAEIGGQGGPRILGVLKGDETGLAVGAEVAGSIDPPHAVTRGYPSVRWTISR